jgi:hypothetical protein
MRPGAMAVVFVAAMVSGSMGSGAHADTWTVPSAATPTLEFALGSGSTPVRDGDVIELTEAADYTSTYTVAIPNLTIRAAAGQSVVIDARGAGRVFSVGASGDGLTLEGLTITGGNALPDGGGIEAIQADLTLRGCVVIANVADDDGGGLAAVESDVVLEDTVIADNVLLGGHSNDDGAGIQVRGGSLTMIGCTITGNTTGGAGGGVLVDGAQVNIAACVIEMNTAGFGGGLAARGGSTGQIRDTTISGNTARGDGGGASLTDTGLAFLRCRLVANQTAGPGADDGGALSVSGAPPAPVVLTSCLLAANAAASQGGAAAVTTTIDGVVARFVNCTIIDNAASTSGGAIRLGTGDQAEIVGCIVRGHGPGALEGAGYAVAYSNVEGGFPGEAVIDADPLFVDAPGGDYRLGDGSPCADAGDSHAVAGANPMDLAGEPRAVDDPDAPDVGLALFGMTADMGAFERQAPPCSGTPGNCPADIDGDDDVDVFDFAELASSFGCGSDG